MYNIKYCKFYGESKDIFIIPMWFNFTNKYQSGTLCKKIYPLITVVNASNYMSLYDARNYFLHNVPVIITRNVGIFPE